MPGVSHSPPGTSSGASGISTTGLAVIRVCSDLHKKHDVDESLAASLTRPTVEKKGFKRSGEGAFKNSMPCGWCAWLHLRQLPVLCRIAEPGSGPVRCYGNIPGVERWRSQD